MRVCSKSAIEWICLLADFVCGYVSNSKPVLDVAELLKMYTIFKEIKAIRSMVAGDFLFGNKTIICLLRIDKQQCSTTCLSLFRFLL